MNRNFIVAIFGIFFTFHCSAQLNSDWIQIEKLETADTYINQKTIIINGNRVEAWVRWHLVEPIKSNSKTKISWGNNSIHAFGFNKTYDCLRKSVAINALGIYNEKAEFIKDTEKPDSEITLASPDTLLYREIVSVCDYAKTKKITKEGWDFVDYVRFQKLKVLIDKERELIKKEMDDGLYGTQGIASDLALKRVGRIIFNEGKIENLAIEKDNWHALDYSIDKLMSSCMETLKDEKLSFSAERDCIKSADYLAKSKALGSPTAGIYLGFIAFTYNYNSDYESILLDLYRTNIKRLTDQQISSYKFVLEQIEKKLSESQRRKVKALSLKSMVVKPAK
jgi:hypothetical protein